MTSKTSKQASKTSAQALKRTLVPVDSYYSKLFTKTLEGVEVEIKEVDNIEDYPLEVVAYPKTAAKGKNKGQTLYAVAVADYRPRKRSSVSVADKIKALKSQGMTDAQVLQALQG